MSEATIQSEGRTQSAADLKQKFREKAEAVSAIVVEAASLDEAYEYAIDACEKKDACRLLVAGCDLPLSEPSEETCETKQRKIIAAPALDDAQYAALEKLAADRDFFLIRSGLRDHLAGIDIGFTIADYGIAETGTLVIDSSPEDLRLATMISETHVAVLPLSRLRAEAYDLEEAMRSFMGRQPDYMAYITGASRTADIERVLALGVHGPLELHIVLWEDE